MKSLRPQLVETICNIWSQSRIILPSVPFGMGQYTSVDSISRNHGNCQIKSQKQQGLHKSKVNSTLSIGQRLDLSHPCSALIITQPTVLHDWCNQISYRIVGWGKPFAPHLSVTFSPCSAVMFCGGWVITGCLEVSDKLWTLTPCVTVFVVFGALVVVAGSSKKQNHKKFRHFFF